MKFEEKLKEFGRFTDKRLDELLEKKDNYQAVIYDAMRYSLLAGGKRIRPVICYAVSWLFGIGPENCADYACAVEMIHTYSLIHDDLPAMDNDDYRRGRLSNHKVYGEANAILAGDALLTKAFEVCADRGMAHPDDPGEFRKAVKIIGKLGAAAGADGMVGGQVIDLYAEDNKIDNEEHRELCRLKTGCLLTVPAEIACILAGRDGTEEGELAVEYAKKVGLAFQVKDDILDVEGDAALLGKAVGIDKEDNKTTFVTLYGLDGAKALLTSLTQESLQICDRLAEIPGIDREAAFFMKQLGIFLLERNH